jgi:hypothetical protein
MNHKLSRLIFFSYTVIEPGKLNKGDIVEAQVSFQVVPIKNNMFKLLVVLRAITLLDNRPTKVCQPYKI